MALLINKDKPLIFCDLMVNILLLLDFWTSLNQKLFLCFKYKFLNNINLLFSNIFAKHPKYGVSIRHRNNNTGKHS